MDTKRRKVEVKVTMNKKVYCADNIIKHHQSCMMCDGKDEFEKILNDDTIYEKLVLQYVSEPLLYKLVDTQSFKCLSILKLKCSDMDLNKFSILFGHSIKHQSPL